MANTIDLSEKWLRAHGTLADQIAELGLPADTARVRRFDARLPGFGVVIGKRSAVFIVRHRQTANGKQTDETIGTWRQPGAGTDRSELWTEDLARKRANLVIGGINAGIKPSKSTAPPTLRDAFDKHVESLRKKVKAGKRSDATIETFEKSKTYLKHLLDVPITDLTGEALIELHEKIKREAKPRANARNEKGAPVANRVITNVGTAWATLNKQMSGKLGTWNPAKAVDKETLVPKRVVLVDLPDWNTRVQTMRNAIQRDGLVFALFTGLRSEDVRSIRFEHVNKKAETLRLVDPKGGTARAFTIPLPKTCLEIVERRQRDNRHNLGRDAGDGGWLFPAVDASGAVGPISDLREQRHEGEKHWRFPVEDVHSLRRTYTTIAHEAGISELDARVLTNHKFASGDVHEIYIAQHHDHLARCQAKIEKALLARLTGTTPVKRKPRAKRS